MQGLGLALTGSGSSGASAHPAQVVCTLAERDYFCGAAALVNSLARAGFEGTVVIGCRGAPPDWLGALARDPASDAYVVTPAVRLRLIEVGGGWHLNNCKPGFIEDVLFTHYPASELVYYFDTDIVITHAWSTFARWAEGGVVLVLDPADTYMSPHHVYRRGWRELAARQGRTCRDVTGYVNGGCVGLARPYAGFAAVWRSLMQELERDGADMRKMKNATGKLEFLRMDQDVLNAALMAADVPLSLLGPEAMSLFPWAGEVMPHAMWQMKPWKRNYVFDALRGFPPDRAHRAYWEYADQPIRIFSDAELRRKRLTLALGKAIGYLHSRSLRDL